jgi:putative ubiquitin-RnfH superfamily antitoxin RatB of RatAB toxin-antitoxin module
MALSAMEVKRVLTAVQNASTIEDAAKALGLTVSSFQQKMSVMRKAGIPVREFRRGRSAGPAMTDADITEIAEVMGITPEEYRRRAAETQAQSQARSQAVKAGREAAAAARADKGNP